MTLIAKQEIAIRQDRPSIRGRQYSIIMLELFPQPRMFAASFKSVPYARQFHSTGRGVRLAIPSGPPITSEPNALCPLTPDPRFVEWPCVLIILCYDFQDRRTGRMKETLEVWVIGDEGRCRRRRRSA